MQTPLCNKKYLLEKFPGKGGWTYARIPEFSSGKRKYSSFTKVSGTIDGYEISNATLMSMGNKQYFLPVNAAIRKKIGKEAGDKVHITLHVNENTGPVAADEFTDCLKDEPAAWEHYLAFSKADQKAWVKWVNEPVDEKLRIERIAAAVTKIATGKKLEN
ncbi:YdeI/OmpD-associated family protein [Chitinophaga sp.]|uniref:YdeI/OmpD-associated family protein n=1 Tax=Chitinophaga sp. TaxID=1869181 RepID=UPI0031D3C147